MYSKQTSKAEFVDIDAYIQNLKEKTERYPDKTKMKPAFQKEEREKLDLVKTDLS